CFFFFFSSRRRHTRWPRDWSSDVCSSDLLILVGLELLSSFGFRHSDFNFLPFQIPRILIEVNIVIAPFEFASLEIDGIGTHRARSEERRVGKEGRERGAPTSVKNKVGERM